MSSKHIPSLGQMQALLAAIHLKANKDELAALHQELQGTIAFISPLLQFEALSEFQEIEPNAITPLHEDLSTQYDWQCGHKGSFGPNGFFHSHIPYNPEDE